MRLSTQDNTTMNNNSKVIRKAQVIDAKTQQTTPNQIFLSFLKEENQEPFAPQQNNNNNNNDKATFISQRLDFNSPVNAKQEEQPKHRSYTRDEWKQIIKQTGKSHISFSELEQNLRNGIPEDLRPILWFWLSDVHKLERKHKGQYEILKNKTSIYDEQINKDITRTCSSHAFFGGSQNDIRSMSSSRVSSDSISPLNSKNSVQSQSLFQSTPNTARSSIGAEINKGQQMLFNLLRAYANFDSELGYVQGMNMLAAHILLSLRVEKYINFSRSFGKKCLEHQVEEKAFFIFCHIMVNKNWRQTYLPGFARLPMLVGQLEKKFSAKLKEHFKDIQLEIVPTFQQFYLTLMLKDASSDFGRRIIDLFLHKGEVLIEQIVLKLLDNYQNEILAIKDPFQLQIFIAQEMLKKAIKEHKNDLTFLIPLD